MTTNPQPNPWNKTPLWIIAFSLLTIAICLVALVLRSFMGREPVTAAAAASETQFQESHSRDLSVRIVSPARAASAPSEVGDADSTASAVESPAQTVVQTLQTIVVKPPLRGLALGTKKDAASDSQSGRALAGTITGRVILEGEPPTEKVFTVPELAGCEHLIDHPPTTHNYVVGTNHGLANVFLQLMPQPSPGLREATTTNSHSVTLTLTNCDLQPYLVALAPTDRLVLRNASVTKHVLDFRLREELAPFITVPLEPGVEFTEKASKFVNSGLRFVSVRCAVHEWEQARLAFPKVPRFTITDANGRFALSNVPPYSYRLEIFHGPSLAGTSAPKTTSDVTVFAGATEIRDLRIRPQH